MSATQKKKAKEIIKDFMKVSDDWIVLNASIQTLGEWSNEDSELRKWLIPRIKKLSKDKRKSVAKRAQKFVDKLCK